MASQTFFKDTITINNGETVEAQAPVIISASRATDIPAFYAPWFMQRLRSGYTVWHNPFNQRPVYVSFKKCKVVVFWTKNPKPLIPYLKALDEMGLHYYFHFTLNDYEAEGFEPNVPSLSERIKTFRELSIRIGKEKVIWRFDPVIVTPALQPGIILERIQQTGNLLKEYTNRFVFSFVDIDNYRKVQRNLIRESLHFSKKTIAKAELTAEQMNEIAEGLMKIRVNWLQEGYDINFASCAEKIDLEQYGINHNRCIDSELMKRIFQEDKDLVHFLNYGTFPEGKEEPIPSANPLPLGELLLTKKFFSAEKILPAEKLKDKGQRKTCGCMVSKDIGMYNTCRHFCVYCYANNSKETSGT